MIEPGTTLLGKYLIERVLGKGGMGVVLLARHLMLEQRVAIKCLLPRMLEKKDVVERFRREARAASRLSTEHVCRVFDVGVLESGAPYMVTEYLDGQDLGELAKQQGRLAPGHAVDLMLQACEALAEAHSLGIVHRDLKPANFFLTRRADGSPLLKLLDFGISKAPVTVDEGLTSTQAVMGTPAYMSPEQMRSSKQADARSDIWALGVVLYELIEGRRPFRGGSFSDLCLKVAMDPAAPLTAEVPPGLEGVIMRCLEKAPAQRFQSVAELAAALALYAATQAQGASTIERTSRILGVTAVDGQAATPGPARAPSAAGIEDAGAVSPGATVLGKNVTGPGAGAGMPGEGAAMPGAGVGMPGAGAGMPGEDAAMPGAGAGMPGEGAAMPGAGVGMPGEGAAMPGAGVGMPGEGAAMPAMPGAGVIAPTGPPSTLASSAWATAATGDASVRARRLPALIVVGVLAGLALAVVFVAGDDGAEEPAAAAGGGAGAGEEAGELAPADLDAGVWAEALVGGEAADAGAIDASAAEAAAQAEVPDEDASEPARADTAGERADTAGESADSTASKRAGSTADDAKTERASSRAGTRRRPDTSRTRDRKRSAAPGGKDTDLFDRRK